MSQQQFEQPRRRQPQDEVVEQLRPQTTDEGSDASFDDLLDQIDAVIERNPEEYVRSFVQRGGQ